MSQTSPVSASADQFANGILEAVTDELLAHGEFSSGANNRSNAREAARVVIDMVRTYDLAQRQQEPVAWLDIRTAGLDWQNRIVATNPQFVENNGPENFVALFALSDTSPLGNSQANTTGGTFEMKPAALTISSTDRAADGTLEALKLAEDVLSRAPFSTDIWPNGMHPQRGINQIREAISKLAPPSVSSPDRNTK